MALTDKQRFDVVYYLGWPGKTLIPESTHYNSIVASRLVNLNQYIEAQTVGLLVRIAKIQSQLDVARVRTSAMSVGDIKMNNMELEQLRMEYMKWIKELSDLLDIKVEKRGSSRNIGLVV
jgi:hypothetical protein